MSDHGFTSWRRAFNLNSWLRDNGYLAVARAATPDEHRVLRQRGLVEDARLRARAERPVHQPERARSEWRRRTGRSRPCWSRRSRQAASHDRSAHRAQARSRRVFRREEVYRLAGFDDIAPDLIVGYAKGTRSSDESALGGLPPRSSTTTRRPGAAITAWIRTPCQASC